MTSIYIIAIISVCSVLDLNETTLGNSMSSFQCNYYGLRQEVVPDRHDSRGRFASVVYNIIVQKKHRYTIQSAAKWQADR